MSRFEWGLQVHYSLAHFIFGRTLFCPSYCCPLLPSIENNRTSHQTTSFHMQVCGSHVKSLIKPLWAFSGWFPICPSDFSPQSKAKDSDKEGTSNSTSEDGPGDGFTILSSKSLVLGQKVIKRIVPCCSKAQLHFYNLLFTSNAASFISGSHNPTFTLVLNYAFLN